MLESTGTLLGALRQSSYRTFEVPFTPGDCLLLYSDALTETEDTQGSLFSEEEASKIFGTHLEAKTEGCARAMESLLTHFHARYAPRLRDDLTLSAYFRSEA